MKVKTDKSAYITTFTGRKLHIFDPDPSEICVIDIAKGLSRIPRFAGQTTKAYWVAQHSVILAKLFLKMGKVELAKFALHHDSAEASVGDLPTPIKYLSSLSGYRKLEKKFQKRIYRRFGLDYSKSHPGEEIIKECGEPLEVKVLDTMLCCNEARDLLPHPPAWSKKGYIPNLKIVPVSSAKAERDFLKLHYKLFGKI